MKKNLFKAIAVSALAVVALAGCTPTNVDSSSNGGTTSDTSSTSSQLTPTVRKVIDVLVWDQDKNQPALMGDYVTFEDVVFLSSLEDSMYVMQQEQSLDPIQVFADNYDDFEIGNVIDVTGTVGTVEGRIVLLDAVATLVDQGEGSFYYYNASRSFFDAVATRTFSGVPMGTTLELVDSVGTLKVGEAKDFRVTFPGEDQDVSGENIWNYFVMSVHVPASLSSREVLEFNQYYASLQSGDFITGYFLYHYVNGASGFLFSELSIGFNSGLTAEEFSGIYDGETRGQDVAKGIGAYVLAPEINYVPTDFSDEGVYSFYLDSSSYGQNGNYSITIMAYTYDTSTVNVGDTDTTYTRYVELLSGIEGLEKYSDDGVFAEFYTEEGNPAVLGIGVQEAMCYVAITIVTENPSIVSGTSNGELLGAYEDIVNGYIAAGSLDLGLAEGTQFVSAIPNFDNLVAEGIEFGGQVSLDRTQESLILDPAGDGSVPGAIIETFESYFYCDATTQNATLQYLYTAFDTYEAMFLEEGFVEGTTPIYTTSSGAEAPALFNDATNEVIMVGAMNGRYGTGIFSVIFEVFVVSDGILSQVFTPAA